MGNTWYGGDLVVAVVVVVEMEVEVEADAMLHDSLRVLAYTNSKQLASSFD
jgi:hypothetical protein